MIAIGTSWGAQHQELLQRWELALVDAHAQALQVLEVQEEEARTAALLRAVAQALAEGTIGEAQAALAVRIPTVAEQLARHRARHRQRMARVTLLEDLAARWDVRPEELAVCLFLDGPRPRYMPRGELGNLLACWPWAVPWVDALAQSAPAGHVWALIWQDAGAGILLPWAPGWKITRLRPRPGSSVDPRPGGLPAA